MVAISKNEYKIFLAHKLRLFSMILKHFDWNNARIEQIKCETQSSSNSFNINSHGREKKVSTEKAIIIQ